MSDPNKSIEWLIKFVDEVAREPGNEWVSNSLLGKLGVIQAAYGSKTYETILSEIYEYCIAKNVSKQAEIFYNNFPILDIKNMLIDFFVKMEKNRRRNDAIETALNIYQQVELVVNHVFESDHCRSLISKHIDSFAFKNRADKLIPIFIMKEKNKKHDDDPSQPYYVLDDMKRQVYFDSKCWPIIIYDPNKETWDMKSRFRAVLYFYCLTEKEREKDFKLNELFTVWKAISDVRNLVHGNNKRKINVVFDKLDYTNDHVKMLFKFHDFLVSFVLRFERGYRIYSEENTA